MNKQDRRLLMERLIVILHGICGLAIGVCTNILVLILLVFKDWVPQTILGEYLLLYGMPILFGSVGFYLAVRKDWWIMKRRW